MIESRQYTSSATLAEIAERIGRSERIALFSHSKPDGDAMGSLLALGRALIDAGRAVDLFIMGPIEPNLLSLAESTPIRRVEDEETTMTTRRGSRDDYDLVIIVDTGSWAQLEPIADWLRPRRKECIILDHHSAGDEDVADLRYIDVSAASATVIVAELLDEMGCELTGGVGGIAEALFLGLATDTGWFRHANTDGRALRLAARLLDMGVDHSRLYQIIEESHRPQRIELMTRALAALEYHCDGQVAVMSLAPDDFADTGGLVEELTGMVNVPLAVDQVRLSILLTQTEPGVTKMSFRSKPHHDDEITTTTRRGSRVPTASEIAEEFGGGGHVHAAGARVQMDLADVRQRLADVLKAGSSMEPQVNSDKRG